MKKEISAIYFQTFARKDLDALRRMFADNVSLLDWNINVQGIEAVMAANQAIFESVGEIRVTPVNIVDGDSNAVIAELLIEIEGMDALNVVDVLVFNQSGEITAIRAYKR